MNLITIIKWINLKNTKTNCIIFPIANINEILYNLNMSVRKIKKSYLSCTGYFASYKNNNQIAFESVMERDLFMILEFDDSVLKYEEQPMQVYYPYNDTTRRYTPDVLITYKDNSKKLIEVKYANELTKNKDLVEKIDILKNYFLNEHDLNFKLFTDEDIDTQYLDNLKFLYKFVFIPIDKNKSDLINEITLSNKEISIKNILNTITSNRQKQLEYIPYIWNYIFKNLNTLNINIKNKLTMATTVNHIKA